jgi:probable HAF family extracellular repeat protein
MNPLTLARTAGPVVLALALVTTGSVPAGAETLVPPMVSGYRLSDLGTLGGRASSALAVNDAGQVVGYAESTMGRRLAFLWSGGRMRALATPAGDESTATDINTGGDVVGTVTTGAGVSRIVLWSRGDRIRDLGLRGTPVAINDRGQIAGTACSSSGSCYSFLWDRGRVTRPPNTAGARCLTAVEGINARGDVVGTTALRQGTAWSSPYRAALWRRGGGPVDLGALGATGDAYSASHASAVNDRGQVVGWPQTEALPDGHAVVWDGGAFVDLGIAYQSAEGSRATDVNAGGVIVGQSAVAPQAPMVDGVHAVVWTPTGPAKR